MIKGAYLKIQFGQKSIVFADNAICCSLFSMDYPILEYSWEDVLYLRMIIRANAERNLHLLDSFQRQFPGCRLQAEFAKVGFKPLVGDNPSRYNGGIKMFW